MKVRPIEQSVIDCMVHRQTLVLDSEWHAVFDCPLVAPARGRFETALNVSLGVDGPSSATSLARLVLAGRQEGVGWVVEFARLVSDLVRSRTCEMRQLSAKGELSRGLEVMERTSGSASA